MLCKRKKRSAFSLLELMVVIVIIGLLAGAVTISVRSYMTQARQNAAKAEIAKVVDALEMYHNIEGKGYPTSQEGLAVLIQKSEKMTDGYLKGKLTDPWGKPYVYLIPGSNDQAFEVLSFGSDGREGGKGDAADISSANLK